MILDTNQFKSYFMTYAYIGQAFFNARNADGEIKIKIEGDTIG